MDTAASWDCSRVIPISSLSRCSIAWPWIDLIPVFCHSPVFALLGLLPSGNSHHGNFHPFPPISSPQDLCFPPELHMLIPDFLEVLLGWNFWRWPTLIPSKLFSSGIHKKGIHGRPWIITLLTQTAELNSWLLLFPWKAWNRENSCTRHFGIPVPGWLLPWKLPQVLEYPPGFMCQEPPLSPPATKICGEQCQDNSYGFQKS